jgi:hypothetical protein
MGVMVRRMRMRMRTGMRARVRNGGGGSDGGDVWLRRHRRGLGFDRGFGHRAPSRTRMTAGNLTPVSSLGRARPRLFT